jgi:hypothetical protein
MGSNLTSRRRRPEVVATAVRTVSEQLHRSPLGERLAGALPAGDPILVRRPGSSPSWPELRAAAGNRFAGSDRHERATGALG